MCWTTMWLFPVETRCSVILLVSTVVTSVVPKNWLVTIVEFYTIQGLQGVFTFLVTPLVDVFVLELIAVV